MDLTGRGSISSSRMSFLLILLIGASFFGNASAKTYTDQRCSTLHGRHAVKHVPTKTVARTITIPANVKTTITRTRVITPPPATSTTTVFSTTTTTETLSQSTDTFQTTETDFETSTSKTTSTFTTTVSTETTTTLAAGTSTIPTSAGFIPIQSVVANGGGSPSKRKHRRAEVVDPHQEVAGDDDVLTLKSSSHPSGPDDVKALEARREEQICTAKIKNGHIIHNPPQYPTKVSCVKVVKVVSTKTRTYTAPKTRTSAAERGTSTVSSTSVITVTSTATVPDASTTETFRTTSTIETTETVVETSTTTTTGTSTVVPAPTATVYGACNPDNILRRVNGQGIGSLTVNGPQYRRDSTGPTDCCNQCQAAGADCSVWYTLGLSCYLTKPFDQVCAADRVSGNFGNFFGSEGFVLGNSGCGRYRYP
ncbi:MAG: hypothetical protein M1831_005187 [Alyxoria varia]|nr:MAG: hypothetical protein M1831_005187 [Alyxoria varia]